MADENADREKKDPQPKLVSVTLNFISKKVNTSSGKCVKANDEELQKTIQALRNKSKIFKTHVTSVILLFRISAFARIRMPGRVCTSKSKVFLKYLFFFHCH